MEPKPSPPPPPPPAAPSRRRGAATKRKERAASAAPSGSPPRKRQARERVPVDPPPSLPPPQPRSRQPARKSRRKPARKKSTRRSVKPPPRSQQEEEEGPPPPLPAQEEEEGPPPHVQEEEDGPPPPSLPPPPPPPALPPPPPSREEEIEAVLSRGAGVHVVPTFAGWFSWKEIHPIEKQMLATFFDGKSERRTPEIYLGIRNLIMNKFHSNPEVHLESKDLCELSIGEMDARLAILEFLAHWGLVNFHPFPPVTQEHKLVESKSSAEIEDEISPVEKLFQFETVHSYLVPISKKAEAISPVQFTSLLSQPTLAEDAKGAAESSVEYHCNSCSVDCSRKRYHCRTQVDFDFCSECYNEGKFDEGMSKADFILMESAEVPGSGGSNWTDQETLLLLEALQIFKGKEWGEIAEHVATKTKEQCMLYFLQMPISEPFDGEDFNETPLKITEQDSEIGRSDVPDEMDVDGNAEGKESTDEKAYKKANSLSSETRTKLADQNVSEKEDTMDAGGDDLVASIGDESNKSSLMDPAHKKNSANADVSGEHTSNFVIDVLRSTFEALDHFLDQEDLGSFAEAGNPVMALAAFLASLVERDDAVSSCCSSLSEISSALQLATKHCFILPDPPSDLKDPTSTFSACTGSEYEEVADTTQNVNDTDKDRSERKENDLGLEKENATFTSHNEHLELSDTKERGPEAETKSNSTKDSDNPVAKVESSVASDKIRDGCNANAISCSATSNNATEPSSIASQEASAVNTKDTTNPEQVEGDKPSSEELPADVSPSQGKTEPKIIEQATGNGNSEEPKGNESIAASDDPIIRLQRAAGTAISAAAVKAKFLAEQEEGYIRQLTALVVEKQFQKIETKMSFFTEVESLVLRSRESTERMRKKLMLERSMIIASRMGAAAATAAASRTNQQGAPGTRLPVGYALNPQLRRP